MLHATSYCTNIRFACKRTCTWTVQVLPRMDGPCVAHFPFFVLTWPHLNVPICYLDLWESSHLDNGIGRIGSHPLFAPRSQSAIRIFFKTHTHHLLWAITSHQPLNVNEMCVCVSAHNQHSLIQIALQIKAHVQIAVPRVAFLTLMTCCSLTGASWQIIGGSDSLGM